MVILCYSIDNNAQNWYNLINENNKKLPENESWIAKALAYVFCKYFWDIFEACFVYIETTDTIRR